MLESTKAMKPYAPSMKVDYDNKRKLEIDAIYTKPIEHARANGFVMPKVEMLEKQLVFIENSYLG
jgi:2-dehydropantoate 2-reductase